MSKSLARDEDPASHGFAIWMVIGRRLRIRRCELGIDAQQIANLLGVPARTYEGYEAGTAETPALVLSQAADAFGVPVSWFFQDVEFGFDHEDEAADDADTSAIFTVASEEERIQALSDCFRRLDLEGQQHLLAIAGALSQSSKEWMRD